MGRLNGQRKTAGSGGDDHRGARGIGKAAAVRMVKEGASVALLDMLPKEVAQVAKEMKAMGGKTLGIQVDVTKKKEVEKAVEKALSKWGRVDILVNNAGINSLVHRVTLDEYPREAWEKILAVDLTGVYEVSREAAQVMRKQKSGRIINIASIVGLVPLRLQCAYCLLYTSPSPRDGLLSRMPSSA